MDLAQSLVDLRQSLPDGWLRAFNRFGPPIAIAILVILIGRELAALTWSALSDPAAAEAPALPAAPVTAADTTAPAGRNYAALTEWRPFGEPPEPSEIVATTEILDAPDTTLNLSLHGVHEVTNPDTGRAEPALGSAMISTGRSEQSLVLVGQTIDGGSGAKLHSVYFDRVLLDRGGRLETLRLPLEVAANAPAVPMARPGDTRPQAPAGPTSISAALTSNADALVDVFRPTPHMEGGQMTGFRLAPGRNRDAFNALGLQPGDVMTEVNGLVMNDPRAAAQVFSALSETSVASVTIVRDGSPQVLTIDLSTIEPIMENSQ